MGKKSISNELIKKCSEYYNSDLNNKVYSDAVIRNGLVDVALRHDAIANMHFHFSEEIDVGKVTNQKKTGRCWMFAGLNCIRHSISKKLQMEEKDFELSQNYIFFWDKLEKSNLFLENIIATIDKDLEDHEVIGLLSSPVQEGGRWGLFAKLIEKYGVVPKYAMPDSKASEDSKMLNEILNYKMREYAKILRGMYREGKLIDDIREEKESMLIDVYNILCRFMGEPPKTFDFEYRDVDGDFHRERNITPLDFYNRFSDVKPKDYIVLVNYPTEDKPFGKTYTLKYHGNVVDGEPIKYLNMDIDVLKELAIAQIKGGEQVSFGCDVGKMSHREFGIMDTNLFNYETVLNTKFIMDKSDRLMYRASGSSHVMTFVGVNLVDGKPNRWKVQNSWGESEGNEGFYVMSDEWFDEYVLRVAINKKYVPKEIMEAYEQEPIVLSPWNTLGPVF